MCSNRTVEWTATLHASNPPPTFRPPAPPERLVVRGTTEQAVPLFHVNDAETPPGDLAVELLFTSASPTISNLGNTGGVVTADVTYPCATLYPSRELGFARVVDDGGLFTNPMVKVSLGSDIVVTPPPPFAVNQTSCFNGVPGAVLSKMYGRHPDQVRPYVGFLRGGSATASRFPPAVSVTDTTYLQHFFPAGTTVLDFKFKDTSGWTNTAPGTLVVFRQGDLDRNEVVDVFDLVTLASHIVGNVPAGTAPFNGNALQADNDDDGDVDLFDLVLLAAFVVGNATCLTP